MKTWMISWVVHLLLRCLNPFLLLVTRSNYPPHLPLAGQALVACGLLPCFVWWCEIPTEVLRILSRSWFPIFSVHSDFICKFDLFGEKHPVGSLPSPSGRRRLKAGWGATSNCSISSHFPFTKFPHPPLTWSPLPQNGRGFWVIDFICKFDLFGEKPPVGFLPSPSGHKYLHNSESIYLKGRGC